MRNLVARLAPFSVAVALAVPAVLAATGCKPPPYPQCKKDKHCKVNLGEKCVDGKCQNCTTDADCADKAPPDAATPWVCADFRCQDPATLGNEGAGSADGKGDPCTQTIDCINGWVCREGTCDACVDDIECEGGTCDFSTGQCSTGNVGGGSCQTDDECAMDEICDAGVCVFSGIEPGGEDPCNLRAIYFDFDSPKIRGESAEQLKALAECMITQGRLVYLEAHADPRGTEEYNIMLTDKRGQSVKKFLQDLGVTGENMQVISKGALEAIGTNESEWQEDRRVEFIWP